MNRDQVIRAAGVVSVSLFGSTARGEADPGDVDIAVRLAESFSRGGFDYFGRLEDLAQHRFQKEIDKDRALAF